MVYFIIFSHLIGAELAEIFGFYKLHTMLKYGKFSQVLQLQKHPAMNMYGLCRPVKMPIVNRLINIALSLHHYN